MAPLLQKPSRQLRATASEPLFRAASDTSTADSSGPRSPGSYRPARPALPAHARLGPPRSPQTPLRCGHAVGVPLPRDEPRSPASPRGTAAPGPALTCPPLALCHLPGGRCRRSHPSTLTSHPGRRGCRRPSLSRARAARLAGRLAGWLTDRPPSRPPVVPLPTQRV